MVCPQQISDDNDDDGVNIDNDDEEDAVREAKSIDFWPCFLLQLC